MQKNRIIPILCASAIVGTLVLSGCSNTSAPSTSTTPVANKPAVTTPTTPAVIPPPLKTAAELAPKTMNIATAATATTATKAVDIGAKLKAGGITFTSEDQLSKVIRLTTKDAVSKGTKYKIKGSDGNNVDITVLELSKPEQMAAVKKEIEGQLVVVKQISPTMNAEFIDGGAKNLLIILTYRTADKAIATKATLAMAQK